jgi:uncharacterized membrane protein YphA (DoxX/SURF4 family)
MPGYLQNFDLTNGYNILHVIRRAFFIPHIGRNSSSRKRSDSSSRQKFRPPVFWLYTACAVEIVLATGLVLAIYPLCAGLIAALHLTVATIVVYRVTSKWLWNIGRCEFPLFWAICRGMVAIQA